VLSWVARDCADGTPTATLLLFVGKRVLGASSTGASPGGGIHPPRIHRSIVHTGNDLISHNITTDSEHVYVPRSRSFKLFELVNNLEVTILTEPSFVLRSGSYNELRRILSHQILIVGLLIRHVRYPRKPLTISVVE
jgi:hypothetical protein